MAPEYAMRGCLTSKADVYSFGVVALEIVSGKSNTNYMPKEDFVYLLDWVKSTTLQFFPISFSLFPALFLKFSFRKDNKYEASTAWCMVLKILVIFQWSPDHAESFFALIFCF